MAGFAVLNSPMSNNPLLSGVYDRWSFNVLPKLGQLVAGDAQSYHYLVESIRQFPRSRAMHNDGR